jgi:hypothetical protein
MTLMIMEPVAWCNERIKWMSAFPFLSSSRSEYSEGEVTTDIIIGSPLYFPSRIYSFTACFFLSQLPYSHPRLPTPRHTT